MDKVNFLPNHHQNLSQTMKRNIKVVPKIGEGIYISTDVAKILKLDPYKVRRLMNGFWDAYTFGEKREKAINFLGLIEFFVYFHCRENKMSAQRIKKFHEQLSSDLNTPYPFAHYHIRTDFKNMWAEESGNLLKADGKHQYDFLSILDDFLHRISYGDNKLASEFYPLHKSNSVVIDPMNQFGQPIIKGTNIKTKTIFTLHKGGEKDKFISELYGIPVKAVKDAIAFHKQAA